MQIPPCRPHRLVLAVLICLTNKINERLAALAAENRVSGDERLTV